MKRVIFTVPVFACGLLTGCETWHNMWDRDSDSSRARSTRSTSDFATAGATLGVQYPMANPTAGYDDSDAWRTREDRMNSPSSSSNQSWSSDQASTNTPSNETRDSRTRVASAQNTSENYRSAEARVLSYMHTKNQEEIEMGRLAQTRGGSPAVREYGEMLVNHHSENDRQVMSVASSAGVQLTQTGPGDRNSSPSTTPPPSTPNAGNSALQKEVASDLRNLNGTEFDRAFADKMTQGHREAIRELESARPNIQNTSVRSLVDQTLPVLREHEQRAQSLK